MGTFACFTCFACCVFQNRYILYMVDTAAWLADSCTQLTSIASAAQK
jgi:hypothetical protein